MAAILRVDRLQAALPPPSSPDPEGAAMVQELLGGKFGEYRQIYELVEHPATRALTGYLLVRGGVHQVAYARALERLTGGDLMKRFPSPRIPTDEIPQCRPHIERGEHLKLYRLSESAFNDVAAVFNSPHSETGEDLLAADEPHPEGAPANDLPVQPDVSAPSYAPEEIAEIAQRLRNEAGFSRPRGARSPTLRGRARRARPEKTASRRKAAPAVRKTRATARKRQVDGVVSLLAPAARRDRLQVRGGGRVRCHTLRNLAAKHTTSMRAR